MSEKLLIKYVFKNFNLKRKQISTISTLFISQTPAREYPNFLYFRLWFSSLIFGIHLNRLQSNSWRQISLTFSLAHHSSSLERLNLKKYRYISMKQICVREWRELLHRSNSMLTKANSSVH